MPLAQLEHIAVRARDLDGMHKHFSGLSFKFEARDTVGAGWRRIFFFPDPNGVTIETNFLKPA
jgi:hypothetical protein